MPPSQEARVRRAFAGCVHLTLVLGSLFLIAILAQTDSELPGNGKKPPPSKKLVCVDCEKWVVPVYPEDGTGPKCPNNAEHKLRRQ
jgi:hypothetical protein